jgi:hypothetical protein
MTNDGSDWQVTQVRAETVEVTNSQFPQVRYILKATTRDVRLEAFEQDKLVEEIYVTRAIHEFIIEASDGPNSFMRLAIRPTKDTTVTYVILDNEEFQVESAASEHAFLLNGELNKRRIPRNQRLKLLVQDLMREDTLLNEIKRHTNFGPSILHRRQIDNGVVGACVAICAMCAFGHFPACVGCAICIEMGRLRGGGA